MKISHNQKGFSVVEVVIALVVVGLLGAIPGEEAYTYEFKTLRTN